MVKSGEKFPDDQFPLSLIPVNSGFVRDMDHRESYGPAENPFDPDAVEGLAGLIALGDAWESVDVFGTLYLALKSEENNLIAELALLRVRELESGGKHSLTGKLIADEIVGEEGTSMDRGAPRKFFSKARQEADAWHRARQEFMAIQFGLGRHADTHDDFWDAFDYEDEAPTPPDQWSMKTRALVTVGVGLLAIFTGLGLLAWLVVKVVRKIQSSFQGSVPVSS